MVNLDKITKEGKALFLAYDQGMEHGPSDFNDENIDPNYILSIGLEGGFNAIIFQKGVAEKYYDPVLHNEIPLIVKLNGKTNLLKEEPYSPLLATVDEAIALGASAVGYTIYVGSTHEAQMFAEFAQVERQAHAKHLPVVVWMYPRGKAIEGKDKAEITAYAARIGLELGADVVKVQYPGTMEATKQVVAAAGKTKVVISGGEKQDEASFLAMAEIVMKAGAAGLAVGRNIWQAKDPLGVTEKLKKIIFTG